MKVNWKRKRIEQAPVGGNQFAYYMFDATKKKEASQDEVSLNILNLYLDTGVLTKAVVLIYASSVYRKLRPPSVSRGKAKKAYAALGFNLSVYRESAKRLLRKAHSRGDQQRARND